MKYGRYICIFVFFPGHLWSTFAFVLKITPYPFAKHKGRILKIVVSFIYPAGYLVVVQSLSIQRLLHRVMEERVCFFAYQVPVYITYLDVTLYLKEKYFIFGGAGILSKKFSYLITEDILSRLLISHFRKTSLPNYRLSICIAFTSSGLFWQS